MKVKKLQEMLRDGDSNAEVMLYLVHESGYRIAPIGLGDAEIGWDEDGTILLPADLEQVPCIPWEDEDGQEGTLTTDEDADKEQAIERLHAILDRADQRDHQLPKLDSDDPQEREDAQWIEEMREAKQRWLSEMETQES